MAAALAMSSAALADTSQWTIVADSLDAGANGAISSVSCAGTTCWGVGGQSSITAGQPAPALLEGNTGNGWFIAADPSPDLENGLNGVTCVDAGDCWAVGSGTADQTLIERYVDGAWAFVPSPALLPPDPHREAFLNGVACTSLTDCWAVGGAADPGSAGHTLIEHYDGTDWTVVSSPNIGSQDNFLSSVACPAATDCWAVGGANTDAPFTEHYDGAAWTVATDLADVGPSNALNGVTCVSTSECWAVGYQGDSNASFTQTVIEGYDGTRWSRVSSPNPIGGEWGVNYLKGVSCDSTGVCWAVGQSEGVEGLYTPGQSLIAEYTGSGGWAAVTNPDPGLSGDDFTSVGCGIASCLAGGETSNPASPLLAQGPLGQLSEGGTTGGSSPPPSSGTAAKTAGDLSVPDTGGTGVPWAPLLLAGGASVAGVGYTLRRRMRIELPARDI
jgi:hypothetical protein